MPYQKKDGESFFRLFILEKMLKVKILHNIFKEFFTVKGFAGKSHMHNRQQVES